MNSHNMNIVVLCSMFNMNKEFIYYEQHINEFFYYEQ